MKFELKTGLTTTVIAAAILLSACAVPAAKPAQPAAAPAAATEAPKAEAPKATEAPAAATEAPKAAAPAAAAGAVTLKIVEGESNASYEVEETFISKGNKLATAIGLTPKVNGEIVLNTADPSKSTVGKITVDISLLKSEGVNDNGSGRRDNAIKGRWLESSKYPIAEFTPAKLEGLPTSYKAGDEISFKMTGDMKIREATKSVTWDVKAKYDGTSLTGTATTAIKMSEFNFEAPNIAGMLKAEDDAKLKLDFVAKP